MQFFLTAEGYVKVVIPTGGGNPSYDYVFNYTDHLGNIRLSYSDANKNGIAEKTEILEENNYYAFGLKHKNYNTVNSQPAYKYKYNGKELQDELGLNVYDYGARNYDPAVGRWFNYDPLAEKYLSISSYVYCANNPIIYIDPNGRELILTGDKRNIDRTVSVANQGIGKNILKVDESGNVTMKSLSDKQLSKLTTEQKEMYGVMKDIIKAEDKVNIGVESGSKDVLIGNYDLERIDINDIESYGEGKGVDIYSVLAHEFYEQMEKQINHKNAEDSHNSGIKKEEDVSGYIRGESVKFEENDKGNGVLKLQYFKKDLTETINVSVEGKNNNIISVNRDEEK